MLRYLALTCLIGTVFTDPTTYFTESFDEEWESRWVESEHKTDQGKWKWTAGKFYGDEDKDKGLQTSEDARFYGTSAKFDSFSNEGKTLVIQFTVKHEQTIDCGGGYVKVFPSDLSQKDMHGDSPYAIMFGPDICGSSTKKVHVIFNYKGKNLLVKKDIRCKDDVYTHLYTLIVRSDNTYEVKIDNKKVQDGDLESDWDFLAPKMIKDPEAAKPEDWDDREKVDDEEDTKPEDWEQPEHKPDPEATKPDDWDDREKVDDEEDTKPEDWEQPEHKPDPEATKPDDWDDEMDGEWEPPMIDNPEFKGEWKAKQIPNPNYKGPWIHPEIDNPEYSADDKLYLYKDLSVLGFDLWQVKSGTIFDNILITDDEDYAATVGDETWGETKEAEKTMKEQQDEEEKAAREAEGKGGDDEEMDFGGMDGMDDMDMGDFDDEDFEGEEEDGHDEL